MIYMGPKCIHFYEIPTFEFVLSSRQPYHYHNVIMIFIFGIGLKEMVKIWSDYLAIFSRSTILRGRYWIYQQLEDHLSISEKQGSDTKFPGLKSTSKIILSVEDYSWKFWRQSIIIRYFFWVKWLGIFSFNRCIYSGNIWQLIHYRF